MTTPFTKMHGLGNDFVIIKEEDIPTKIEIKDFVLQISNRSLGIGCDQFITYKMPSDIKKSNIVDMKIYNQDGSKALSCGNASRCLSRLIYDITSVKEIILKVDEREVSCTYINKNEINVDMGSVAFDAPWVPSKNDLWEFSKRYLIEPKDMLCVDVANPHLVIFSKLSDQDKAVIGKNFQNTSLFNDGVNVNFAEIKEDQIYLKTWERGVGFTYACGSGAIATFAAANKLGFADESSEIIFELGSLKMEKIADHITMSGPASYVFSGDYLYV